MMITKVTPGSTKYHKLWLGICGNENKDVNDYYEYCNTVLGDCFFLEYLKNEGYEQDITYVDAFSYSDIDERMELYEIHSKYYVDFEDLYDLAIEGIPCPTISNADLSATFDKVFSEPATETPTPKVGMKNDRKDNKLRMELIPLDALEDIAKVYTEGAKKYTDNSWQDLDNGYERYKGALLRHLCESERSEFDEETGCRHLAQVAWNAIAMLWLSKHDNRTKLALNKSVS